MNRRGFLAGILAAGIAPAVVRAASLMPLVVRDSGLWVYGDSGIFVVPENLVRVVYLSMIGGGGGGGKGERLIAPQPFELLPGREYTITVRR